MRPVCWARPGPGPGWVRRASSIRGAVGGGAQAGRRASQEATAPATRNSPRASSGSPPVLASAPRRSTGRPTTPDPAPGRALVAIAPWAGRAGAVPDDTNGVGLEGVIVDAQAGTDGTTGSERVGT